MVYTIAQYLSGPDVLNLSQTCRRLRYLKDLGIKKFTFSEAIEYENIRALTPFLKNKNNVRLFKNHQLSNSPKFIARVCYKIKEIGHFNEVNKGNLSLDNIITEYHNLLEELYPGYSDMFNIMYFPHRFIRMNIELHDYGKFKKFADTYPDKAIRLLYHVLTIKELCQLDVVLSDNFIKKFVDYAILQNFDGCKYDNIFGNAIILLRNSEYFWEYYNSINSTDCIKLLQHNNYNYAPYKFIRKYAPEIILPKLRDKYFSKSEILDVAQDLHSGKIPISEDLQIRLSLLEISLKNNWPLLSDLPESFRDVVYKPLNEIDVNIEGNAIHFLPEYKKYLLNYNNYKIHDLVDIVRSNRIEEFVEIYTNIYMGRGNIPHGIYCQLNSEEIIKIHMKWNNEIPFPWKDIHLEDITSPELFKYALDHDLVTVKDSLNYPYGLIYLKFLESKKYENTMYTD